ncbi:kinase-like domain-containing protein, partial [Podospora didyma]
TLFHLVPQNEAAHDALLHPTNRRFVSPCAAVGGRPALEIGFHVPSLPSGRVITRIGRNADLILPKIKNNVTPRVPIMAIHIAFEIHPQTLLVLLSVRAKNVSSVKDAALEAIQGDCVIQCGESYNVDIVSYQFKLAWRNDLTVRSLKELVLQEYHGSVDQAKQLRTRDQPDSVDESVLAAPWHNTRLHTPKNPLVVEMKDSRSFIGSGAFGAVFKTVDVKSGSIFVVKVIDLTKHQNMDFARALIHKKIKVLQGVQHDNIIEYLGQADFDTNEPLIYMPFREGNLTSLAKTTDIGLRDELCQQVLEQMLRALDYLDSRKLCHRDVKPDYILFSKMADRIYRFQLADFGLANHSTLARTICGTPLFPAPELHPQDGEFKFKQSPKMDVWSLFVTFWPCTPTFSFRLIRRDR